MKKFIFPIFLFSFIFLIDNSIAKEVLQSSSLPNSCEATLNKHNVTRVKGVKDGVKFSHINHCANDNTELVKYSCDKTTNYWKAKVVKCKNGCKSRKCAKAARATQSEEVSTTTRQREEVTTLTTTPTQQTGETVTQSPTTVSIVTQDDPNTIFEYDTTAHKLAMLDDFVILLNKIIEGTEMSSNHSMGLSTYDVIEDIQGIARDIAREKISLVKELKSLSPNDPYILDCIDLITNEANMISERLFLISRTIRDITYDVYNTTEKGWTMSLSEVNEFLAENQKILNEKLELLKKLTTIKISESK